MSDILEDCRIAKLAGVHPRLVECVKRICYAMNDLGLHMIVTDGARTAEMQKKLYAQGRTAPGDIVTMADGVVRKSNHQTRADGFGYAVDMCFMVDGKPSWADNLPWELYGEMAMAQGLKWGGAWSSLKDRPHIELHELPAGIV